MRTYTILTANRKEVKAKLEELTGKKAAYSGPRSFAYILDGITIGNNGKVTADDGADENVLQSLVDAGLIKADELADTIAETATVSNESAEPEEEPTEKESAPETATEAAETGEEQAEAQTVEEAEGVKPEISFPLSQHTADSLCNLAFTIYSKGDLLSKSTGGDFFVSEALKEKLKGETFTTREQALEILNASESGDLRGMTFEGDKVTFTGFPETQEPEMIRAWTLLAEAINKAAIKQSRVHPKRNEETNEKFAFRSWLTRLGMNGPDLKAERQIYYRNLTGHTAFRTPADAEKWKKRQAERKAERQTAQA